MAAERPSFRFSGAKMVSEGNHPASARKGVKMKIETKDYKIELKSLGEGWSAVYGDDESLAIVTDGIVLAGTEEGSGVVPISGGLRVREGTLALWLQFEILNYLD